jgi:hypothetical protein
MGCDYEAFVPDPHAGWDLQLPADLVADLADAELGIRLLTGREPAMLGSKACRSPRDGC